MYGILEGKYMCMAYWREVHVYGILEGTCWYMYIMLATINSTLFDCLSLYRRIPVHGVALVDALRVFLESFRLLGESPVVERILESFSQHWLVSYEEGGASNSGAGYVYMRVAIASSLCRLLW